VVGAGMVGIGTCVTKGDFISPAGGRIAVERNAVDRIPVPDPVAQG